MVCTSVTNDSVGSAREAPPTGEGMMSDTQGSHATDEWCDKEMAAMIC